MRVLVVEDDPDISRFVRRGLVRAGYSVDHASDGITGSRMAKSARYDLTVLDLMLPGQDGLSVLEEMRAADLNSPVLVLSAKRSTDDKVTCLRSGADDYLAKPFDFPELLARVEALLRRCQPAGESELLESNGIVLDLINRTVQRDGKRIEVSPREFALLELLIRNKGRTLSKSYLLERLWNYRFTPESNLVDVLVCRLRTTVDRDFPVKVIHTVRGLGYVFRAA